MDESLLDAHLYAFGVTTDMRGVRILIVGSDLTLGNQIKERLTHWGAEVTHATPPRPGDAGYDFVIATSAGESGRIYRYLKPGGFWMMVVSISSPQLVLAEVTPVGDTLRVVGMKPRYTESVRGRVEVEAEARAERG